MKRIDDTLSFAPDPNARLSKGINDLIDRALEAEAAAQEPRDYLGGSRLGEECLRRLAYEHLDAQMTRAQLQALRLLEGGSDDADAFLQKRGTPFKGKTLRRFRTGHTHEAETARWLRLAGFDLRTHSKSGRQFGWSIVYPDGKLGGNIDGVFVAGPGEIGGVAFVYPALLEHKIMGSKHWNVFVAKGIRQSHPHYVPQCQSYMLKMELPAAYLCGRNTDTDELHFEHIPFSQSEAEAAIRRGEKVLAAGHPANLPRVAAVSEDFRCKFCPWREPCWSAAHAQPAESQERPKWV